MGLSFMRIDQVVMSGDGFYQSMAYHAYLHLALPNFVVQCTLCLLSIAGAYLLRWRLLRRMPLGGNEVQAVGDGRSADHGACGVCGNFHGCFVGGRFAVGMDRS